MAWYETKSRAFKWPKASHVKWAHDAKAGAHSVSAVEPGVRAAASRLRRSQTQPPPASPPPVLPSPPPRARPRPGAKQRAGAAKPGRAHTDEAAAATATLPDGRGDHGEGLQAPAPRGTPSRQPTEVEPSTAPYDEYTDDDLEQMTQEEEDAVDECLVGAS